MTNEKVNNKLWKKEEMHHGTTLYYKSEKGKTYIYSDSTLQIFDKESNSLEDIYNLIDNNKPIQVIELPHESNTEDIEDIEDIEEKEQQQRHPYQAAGYTKHPTLGYFPHYSNS